MLLTNNTDSSGLFYIRFFLDVWVARKKKETPERKSVHAHMIEMGNLSDKFLENALVNMYVKLESLATWQSFQSDAGARLCLLDSGNYS